MSKTLSVRPYLKFQKKDAKNLVPIYVQVTIDGDDDVFSLSCKVAPENWDQARQCCPGKSQEAKDINTKFSLVKGELARLFQRFPPNETVKASQLINLYFNQDPARKKQTKKKDPTFYNSVLAHIAQQVALVTRSKAAYRNQLPQRYLQAIDEDRHVLSVTVEGFLSETNTWLDDPDIEKTFMDAMYAFLLKYLFKVLKGTHSHESLRKWVSTKNTFLDFLNFRHHCADIALKAIQLKHADHLKDFLMLHRAQQNNTAMKYIKNFKQILNECNLQGWMTANPASPFKCHYVDPEREALTLEEIAVLIRKDFKNTRLNEVRDVFVFCCLTGFAYQEAFSLKPSDVKAGIDKRKWINITRHKSKNPEYLPLLPVAEDIIEKYKTHPYCLKYKKLLPVNSNQRYNSYLDEIGAICGLEINVTTHTARHTFATTIAIEHDIPIKIVSKMLGHKSIRTTEIYARASKLAISRHMERLRDTLFADGRDLVVDGKSVPLDPILQKGLKTKKVGQARLV